MVDMIAVKRVFGALIVGCAVAIMLNSTTLPARGASTGDLSFQVSGYSGPGNLVAHFDPNDATTAYMQSGKLLVWNFGDGTYCESNPVPGSGYVADPNSTCSDPDAVTHTYPATPPGFAVSYDVFIGDTAPPERYNYFYGTEDMPGGPFVNTDTGYEYRLYDNQTLDVDLNPFVTRSGGPISWDVVPTTYDPFLGTATVGTAGILHLVPLRAVHEHQVLFLEGYHDSPESMSLEFPLVLEIQEHAAPSLRSLRCARHSDRHRSYRCAITLYDVDRSGSSTSFTTEITNSTGRRVVDIVRTVDGRKSLNISHYLSRGPYRLTSTSSDGRAVRRSFVVG